MSTSKHTVHNWFDQGGRAYSQFRPQYPRELAAFLASLCPRKTLAVDVGCGNGQLTLDLAQHFESVLGVDPSADQIAHATKSPRIEYHCAPAETLPATDQSTQLITAAQAAHWFDLPCFYREVQRVAAPGCIIALISYGVPRLDAQIDARFAHFYWEEIGPYWPPERKQVDTGYADLPFPFETLPSPAFSIRRDWSLPDLLGYIATWSAVRKLREAAREALLHNFAKELAALWGAPTRTRAAHWPIHMRLGRVSTQAWQTPVAPPPSAWRTPRR